MYTVGASERKEALTAREMGWVTEHREKEPLKRPQEFDPSAQAAEDSRNILGTRNETCKGPDVHQNPEN